LRDRKVPEKEVCRQFLSLEPPDENDDLNYECIKFQYRKNKKEKENGKNTL
jgi:hypothetical protein